MSALTSRLRFVTSFASNVAGQAVPAVFALVFTPLYILFLGVTDFGLLGFFVVIEQLLNTVTGGFAAAFHRALVQAEANNIGGLSYAHRRAARIYGLIGLATAILLSLAAYPIAAWWLPNPDIGTDAVTLCLVLIALRIGLSLPWSIHQSVLQAMGRQEAFNAIFIATISVSGVGCMLAIAFTASLPLYCAVQLVVAFIGLLIIDREASRTVATTGEGPGIPIGEVLRNSMWLMCINGVNLVSGAVDRLAISRFPGPLLGIYNAATAPARMLMQLMGALWVATQPRTNRIAAIGTPEELSRHLGRVLAVASTLILGIGATGIFFAKPFLSAWIDDPLIVSEGPAVMQWAVAGIMIQLLCAPFHMVRVATHKERMALVIDSITLPIQIVALIIGIQMNGIVGAAQGLVVSRSFRTVCSAIHVLGWCIQTPRSYLLILPVLWRSGVSFALAWAAYTTAVNWVPDSPWLQLGIGTAVACAFLGLGIGSLWVWDQIKKR